MDILSLISMVTLPFYIFLGWYVYRLDPKSTIHRLFILLSLCFSIWAFTFIFFYSAPDKSSAWLWYNLSALGRFFYPAVILNMVLIFTKKKINHYKWYNPVLLYILPLIFLFAIFTGPFITQDFTLIDGQWYEILITNNIWWYAYNSYYLIYITLSFLLIGWWGYKSTFLRERKQALIMVISGLVAFILGSLTNTFLQQMNIYVVPSLAQIFGIIFFIGIAYAIVEYKLLKLTTAVAAEEITNKITDLIILLDPDGKIIEINQQVEALLGFSRSDLEGKKWTDLIKTPEDISQIQNFLNQVNGKEDMDKKMEINIQTKDDDNIPFDLSLSVIQDKYGVIGVVLIGRDLRQTKKLQYEIKEKVKAQQSAEIQEEKIKKSLQEREILLKEIHHRVKNNMQIISSLLNLQSEYLKDKTAITALKECQGRIMSMAMIHENLYRSNILTGIEFNGYVDHIIKNIFHTHNISFDKFKVNIIAQDIILNIDTAIPTGLIINELVTNSIKHAFPGRETGEITIQLEQEQDEYYLKVADNGIGISSNLDVNHTSTLGLLLVNSLVSQLDGNLQVATDGGTAFHINFKKLEYLDRI
ncbi:MAG: sensor histidine kinase [Methanothermobacter sp.]